MNNDNLLPCPFCGEKIQIAVHERNRQEKNVFDKIGKLRAGVAISHYVHCDNCGAQGASSFLTANAIRRTEEALLDSHITDSVEEAAFAWNNRAPISNKAFELVNKLIYAAIESVDSATTPNK